MRRSSSLIGASFLAARCTLAADDSRCFIRLSCRLQSWASAQRRTERESTSAGVCGSIGESVGACGSVSGCVSVCECMGVMHLFGFNLTKQLCLDSGRDGIKVEAERSVAARVAAAYLPVIVLRMVLELLVAVRAAVGGRHTSKLCHNRSECGGGWRSVADVRRYSCERECSPHRHSAQQYVFSPCINSV